MMLSETHTVGVPGKRGQWKPFPHQKQQGGLKVYMDRSSKIGNGDYILHIFIKSPTASGEWYVPVAYIKGNITPGDPQAPIGDPPKMPPELVQALAKEKAIELIKNAEAKTKKITESDLSLRIISVILENCQSVR